MPSDLGHTVCSIDEDLTRSASTPTTPVLSHRLNVLNKEYQMLRSAALNIIQARRYRGNSNCQLQMR